MIKCNITVKGNSRKEILKGLMTIQKTILDSHKELITRDLYMEYTKLKEEQ